MKIIKNIWLLPMQGEEDAIQDAELQIEGDTILYAGPASRAPKAQECDEIIDGGARIAMPGFVNTHAHNAMVLFRGAADDLPLHRWLTERIFPMEDELDENAAYWGNMLGIAEMIRSGTVCYNDMYFFTEQEIAAVEKTGIKSVLTRSTACQEMDPVSYTHLMPALLPRSSARESAAGPGSQASAFVRILWKQER